MATKAHPKINEFETKTAKRVIKVIKIRLSNQNFFVGLLLVKSIFLRTAKKDKSICPLISGLITKRDNNETKRMIIPTSFKLITN